MFFQKIKTLFFFIFWRKKKGFFGENTFFFLLKTEVNPLRNFLFLEKKKRFFLGKFFFLLKTTPLKNNPPYHGKKNPIMGQDLNTKVTLSSSKWEKIIFGMKGFKKNICKKKGEKCVCVCVKKKNVKLVPDILKKGFWKRKEKGIKPFSFSKIIKFKC